MSDTERDTYGKLATTVIIIFVVLITLIGLITHYYSIKLAVKEGTKEAFHEVVQEIRSDISNLKKKSY